MSKANDIIARMARDIRTQDNRCTHEPIFLVQRQRRTYGFDPAYTDDHIAYIDANADYTEVDITLAPRCPKCKHTFLGAEVNDDTRTCPACKEELTEKELNRIGSDYEECLKCPECDNPLSPEDLGDENCSFCEKDEGKSSSSIDLSDLGLTKTAYQDSWETVQMFFTEVGAEEYLRVNGHNLRGGKEPPRIYVDSAFRNAEWQAIRAMLLNMNPEEKP